MEPMQSAEPAEAILQLEVRLPGISPTIWHRVLGPESVSLRELHGVLQPAMGWEAEAALEEANATLAEERNACQTAKAAKRREERDRVRT